MTTKTSDSFERWTHIEQTIRQLLVKWRADIPLCLDDEGGYLLQAADELEALLDRLRAEEQPTHG